LGKDAANLSADFNGIYRRKLTKKPGTIDDVVNERMTHGGIVKANEYGRVSALNSAERGGNSRAKTVELQPALAREQAV
jgi:hypothetical protein